MPLTGAGIERGDVEAALAARQELGSEYEPALVDAFVERVEQAIEARVDARLAARAAETEQSRAREGRQLALGITSLALGIPLTAVAGGIADLPGIVATWMGVVGVNASYAWQRRNEGRSGSPTEQRSS